MLSNQSPKSNSVHSSWLEPEFFSNAWCPPVEALEFILISCYVTDAGWRMLEGALTRSLRSDPMFQARLVFSLTGIRQMHAGVMKMWDFIHAPDSAGRIKIFVVSDTSTIKFHPKATGWRTHRTSKVFIGSANLTQAGLGRNFELVAELTGRTHYGAFRQAIESICEYVNVYDLCGYSYDQVAAAFPSFKPIPQAPPEPAEPIYPENSPPASEIFADGQAELEQALGLVKQLAESGQFLVRLDEKVTLSHSVSLEPFIKSSIIEGKKSEDLGHGLRFIQGQGKISLKLLPEAQAERVLELNKRLGNIVGRFSSLLAGGHWLPLVDKEEFLLEWNGAVQALNVSTQLMAIQQHLTGLVDAIRRGDLDDGLKKALDPTPPCRWNNPAARSLVPLHERLIKASVVTPEVRDAVVRGVCDHLATSFSKQFGIQYPLAQLKRSGMLPRFKQCVIVDEADALHFVADLCLLGAKSRLKRGIEKDGLAPGASPVAREFGRRLNNTEGLAERVYRKATEWQTLLSDPEVTSASVARGLLEAVRGLSEWFSISASNLPWMPSMHGAGRERGGSPQELLFPFPGRTGDFEEI